MNKENIKWIAIQPLTGGMYLGTEEAIGHPAEFILSFKGNKHTELNKDGKYRRFGNEAYLCEYLKKKNRNVSYFTIQEGMFDTQLLETLNPTILNDNNETVKPDYNDIDLVVAVPVCSGLSNVTLASQETKDSRNCNMKFITEYTLKVIQPKIYIFENAPGLMNDKGKDLVEHFKKLAKDNSYSVLFYRTDTNLHHNCQRRQRTFVIFFKHTSNNENEEPFVWEYENAPIEINEFFKAIDNSLDGIVVKWGEQNKTLCSFIKEKLGSDWRKIVGKSPMAYIKKNNIMNELLDYTIKIDNQPALRYYKKIIEYERQGRGYYACDLVVPKEHFPSVQFRSIPNTLHPFEDRICTVREYLTLMGHPKDFEWITGDDEKFYRLIGQNVPVKTAKFMIEQCIKCLEKWDEPRGTEFNCAYQDNIKQRKVW